MSAVGRSLLACTCILMAGWSGARIGAEWRPPVESSRDRPGAHLAYVVFTGQVVAVDTDQLRVVKRLDFVHRTDLMWMVHRASVLVPQNMLILAGRRERGEAGEWGVLSLSLPDLRPIQSSTLTGTPMDLSNFTRGVGNRRPVEDGIVVEICPEDRGGHVYRRRFDYLDPRTLRPVATTTLDLPSAAYPNERVWSWTVTPDGRKLLILTSGGFKEQAFLRAYSLPSLTLLRNVPLLDILDHAPVALFLHEP